MLAASAASEPLARSTPPSSCLTPHLCRRRPAPSRHQPAGPRWHRAKTLWTLILCSRPPPALHRTVQRGQHTQHTQHTQNTLLLTHRPRFTFVSASAATHRHTHTHTHTHKHTHTLKETRRWALLWLKQKIPRQDVSGEIRGRKSAAERIKGARDSAQRWRDE